MGCRQLPEQYPIECIDFLFTLIQKPLCTGLHSTELENQHSLTVLRFKAGLLYPASGDLQYQHAELRCSTNLTHLTHQSCLSIRVSYVAANPC